MKDLDRLTQDVLALIDGWNERIEYKVMRDGRPEQRAKIIRHAGLIAALQQAAREQSGTTNNMAPLDLIDTIHEEALDHYKAMCVVLRGEEPQLFKPKLIGILMNLVDVSHKATTYATHIPELDDAATASKRWVGKAKVMLGYKKLATVLGGMRCGRCGGALTGPEGAIRCIGTPALKSCGKTYQDSEWIHLLGGGG